MTKYLISFVVVLALVYSSLFFFSFRGWGYAGYGHSRGYSTYSFWYFGRPTYYMNKSMRGGSIHGRGTTSGGGIHGGK